MNVHCELTVPNVLIFSKYIFLKLMTVSFLTINTSQVFLFLH